MAKIEYGVVEPKKEDVLELIKAMDKKLEKIASDLHILKQRSSIINR